MRWYQKRRRVKGFNVIDASLNGTLYFFISHLLRLCIHLHDNSTQPFKVNVTFYTRRTRFYLYYFASIEILSGINN